MDNYIDQFEQDVQEKPINWREIFDKLLVHWKWFLLSAIIALMVGFVYARIQTDVYSLSSSVLIVDQTRSGQMNEMSVLKQLDAVGLGSKSSSVINNEEQVMKSTVLMKRVVTELELNITYTEHKFLKYRDLYTSSPLYVRMDSLSLSKLSSNVILEISTDNDLLAIDGSYNDSTFSFSQIKLPAVLKTCAGIIYIQQRPGKEITTQDLTVTISNPVTVAKSLTDNSLVTEVGKMIDVINLSIKTTNPDRGRDILNTLAAVYNQDASDQNNLSVLNTARFIDERLKFLTGELSNVERDVENYKKTNKLTSLDEDAKMYLSTTSLYDRQQIEVEMQQNLVKYVDEFVKNPANGSALIPNLGLKDVGLVAVIANYNELILTRVHLANGSSKNNPALITLNNQIDATRTAIIKSIENVRNGLKISNKDLTLQNSIMNSKIKDLPRQEREFVEIKRQQQVKESLYLFLLQKREEASLNMAVAVPKGRVLNTPDSAQVVGPKRKLIILAFLFIGLVIPAVIIYTLELLNTSVRNREDVEKLTKIPVITELGHSDTEGIFIDQKVNSSSNSELFRLLRTKLQFTLDYPSEKIILVTSTMSGEGKTFVSINLASMLALADKKVLLMDLDLRKPRLAKYFNIEKRDGISYYLSGKEANYKTLITSSTEYPNLDVFTAGVIPPNPTELIMKERFEILISELKQQYDFIIIDTAPVGAVSDTFLVDRVADICLYVCRASYTDKRNFEFINRIKDENSLKRMYFVVNDVDLEANRYSYHTKYGYGYGYGRS